jgi:ATP-dependent helicase/nuclease subunit B
MSVTKIETWMRHPYGIYSEMILRLKPLDPLERGLQPSDRGIFIHRALETFLTTPQIESLLPLDPEASLSTLLKIGEALASRLSDQILVKTVWWPRFQQMAHWFIKTQGPLCAQLQKVFCEISGSLTWEAPAGPFTLTAKADRIDALKTGKLRFIDYKTNTAPSQKDVALGYSPQLTVAAWMAQAGGFEGMAAGSPQELSYWILKGGHKGGHVVSITPPKEKTLDCLVKEAQEGVHQLVALFDDPTTPYLYCPRPEKGPLFDPYDHLARVGEWRTSL